MTEEQKAALRAILGCGCCSFTDEALRMFPDDCPVVEEDGYSEVEHTYSDDCGQGNRLGQVGRILGVTL